MAVLSWGKCKIETTPSTNGAPADNAEWKALDTPKEDTTKITPTAGTEKTATEEGGELVDVRYGKTPIHSNLTCLSKKVQNARLMIMTG